MEGVMKEKEREGGGKNDGSGERQSSITGNQKDQFIFNCPSPRL